MAKTWICEFGSALSRILLTQRGCPAPAQGPYSMRVRWSGAANRSAVVPSMLLLKLLQFPGLRAIDWYFALKLLPPACCVDRRLQVGDVLRNSHIDRAGRPAAATQPSPKPSHRAGVFGGYGTAGVSRRRLVGEDCMRRQARRDAGRYGWTPDRLGWAGPGDSRRPAGPAESKSALRVNLPADVMDDMDGLAARSSALFR